MDFFVVGSVAGALLLAALVMLYSHVRSWRNFRQLENADPKEWDYRHRQYRRRMQTSALLALVAVALVVGQVLTWWLKLPWFTASYWLVVILLVCWMGLLGIADILATKHYYGQLRHHCLVEQAKLRAELNRTKSREGNGKPNK